MRLKQFFYPTLVLTGLILNAGCMLEARMTNLESSAGASSDSNNNPTTPDPGGTPALKGPNLKQLSQIAHAPSFQSPIVLNGKLIFPAGDYDHGIEVWAHDPNNGSFELLKDCLAGSVSSAPVNFTLSNNYVFFEAKDSNTVYQLWRTDGTPQGTIQLSQFSFTANSANAFKLTAITGGIFFVADDGSHGLEIWSSDGSISNTKMVADISPGTDSSFGVNSIIQAIPVAGKYYFSANTAATGNELWVTDGTTAGTTIAVDIVPGTTSSNPLFMTAFNGKILFVAGTPAEGLEPWISDGTTIGTELLRNISGGSGNSQISSFLVAGTKAYFYAKASSEAQIYETDGTPTNTVLASSIDGGFATTAAMFYTSNGLIFHMGMRVSPATFGLHAYNVSSTVNTFLLAATAGYLMDAKEMGGFLYVRLLTITEGVELFKIDLTTLAVSLVKDINPGIGFGLGSILNVNAAKLLIMATDGTSGYDLWETDGTGPGTNKVKDMLAGSLVANNTRLSWFNNLKIGSYFYFYYSVPNDLTRMWRSDGTTGGTTALPLSPATVTNLYYSDVGFVTSFSDKLIIKSLTVDYGHELWSLNSTNSALGLLKDISNTINTLMAAHIQNFFVFQNKLFFNAIDPVNGETLWSSDGTAAGTQMALDTVVGAQTGSPQNVVPFASFNNNLYFRAHDNTNGNEIWTSNGSVGSGSVLKDISAGTLSTSLEMSNTVEINGKLLMALNTATNGAEIWETNGTAGTTNLLKEINAAAASGLSTLGLTGATVGNEHYFSATDGTTGFELWKTNGTSAGTVFVKDINPGPTSSLIKAFAALDGKFVFAASDGVAGQELWVSDGTATGTVLLMDIDPGSPSGLVSPYLAFVPFTMNGKKTALFFARNALSGSEPWITDGTVAGTYRLKDINPGSKDSGSLVYDSGFYKTSLWNEKMYFLADDGTNGREVWVTDGTVDGTRLYYDTLPGRGTRGISKLYVAFNRLFAIAQSPFLSNELFEIEIK